MSKIVQVDEAELNTLRGAARLLDQLRTNPKTTRSFQKDVKTLYPETITDEDRLAEAPEVQRLNKLEERLDNFFKKTEEKELDGQLAAAFSRLRKDEGFTDEGIESVKRLMVDRKVMDVEAAAALWKKQNPEPQQLNSSSVFSSTGFGFGRPTEDAMTKLLFENEDEFADREFAAVMNEKAA